MYDLPDWIEEKIGKPNPDYEVLQADVARVFVEEEERPFLTRRKVQSELKGDPSRGTVNSRLSELVEIGVLESDEPTTNTYWLSNEKSDWPIPPDVRVESVNPEIRVSEFFQKTAVRVAGWGIALILISSWTLWVGVYFIAQDFSIPLISNTLILATGLSMILFGWLFILFGMVKWLQNPETLQAR